MRIAFSLITSTLIFNLYGQQSNIATLKAGKELDKNYYIEFNFVESGIYNFKKFNMSEKPEFPGGIQAFKKYISDKLSNIYLLDKPVIRTILFDIERDGDVCNIRLGEKSDCGICDTQIVRSLYDMPQWISHHAYYSFMSCKLILELHKDSVSIKDIQYFRLSTYTFFYTESAIVNGSNPPNCDYITTEYTNNPFLFIDY